MNLTGSKWKAVVNGKRALNGNLYSATFIGDVAESTDGMTIYDVVKALGPAIQSRNAEMEHPVSIQITFCTPEALKE